jgi:hypothetical protein
LLRALGTPTAIDAARVLFAAERQVRDLLAHDDDAFVTDLLPDEPVRAGSGT